MKSMTGFGSAAAPLGGYELSVQISAVNRRGLEVVVGLPDDWRELEAPITDKVRAVATRGRISVVVSVRTPENKSAGLADESAVNRTLDQLAAFAAKRGATFSPDAALIWQVAAALRTNLVLPAPAEVQDLVLEIVGRALAGFCAMRGKEGATLLHDLVTRTGLIRGFFVSIAERAPAVPGVYRENLQKRFRESGLPIDLDDERVLKELALFADRCDITEEITRARSHLDQLEALLKSDGEIGRKAEFIMQELGREVNTTGSKANDLSIAKLVIEAKNELERMREQVANVE